MSARVIQSITPLGGHVFILMKDPLVRLDCGCAMIAVHVVCYCKDHVPKTVIKGEVNDGYTIGSRDQADFCNVR